METTRGHVKYHWKKVGKWGICTFIYTFNKFNPQKKKGKKKPREKKSMKNPRTHTKKKYNFDHKIIQHQRPEKKDEAKKNPINK